MSKYFSISDTQRTYYKDLVLDLIEAFGKTVTIYYPGTMEECVNCIYDPIGHKSSNKFRTGGIIPFGNGLPCPVCNGAGKRTKIITETGKFLCTWNLDDNYVNTKYLQVGNIRLPQGNMLVRGPIEYLTKFQSCDYFVVNVMNKYRFKVDSEPFDPGNIVSEKIFALMAKRV